MPENNPFGFLPLQLRDWKSSGFLKLRVTTKTNILIIRFTCQFNLSRTKKIYKERIIFLVFHDKLQISFLGIINNRWTWLLPCMHAYSHICTPAHVFTRYSNTTDASERKAVNSMALWNLLNSVRRIREEFVVLTNYFSQPGYICIACICYFF